ncbi:hypothetical protein Dred_2509 [Desulforamulus reducens MI-1]|uniref:Uncharacterized protein n=1 Tax=Desulforamulus reducens (strain ATCC BAA-1160 / DSM 100696 / MI-1) TaxID=349161 RepID=A4J7G6_DESRM|nr:hypothetical protein [Desulforamulus reducens]ABO51019.1 hypothetical protein Dred_2509 [Desulforamulus reducens MI-1]
MFSPNHMEMLMKKIMDQLGFQINGENNGTNKKNKNNKCNKIENCLPTLTPSQMLVILGLLGGVFEVDSVLVDKDQVIQVVLSGSLKRKTELEKIMEQVGTMPFDDVMKAIFGRY